MILASIIKRRIVGRLSAVLFVQDEAFRKLSRKYVRHIKFDCNLHQCDAGCSLFMGCDIGLSYFADNALQFPERRSA